jgi:hypothetical protein
MKKKKEKPLLKTWYHEKQITTDRLAANHRIDRLAASHEIERIAGS